MRVFVHEDGEWQHSSKADISCKTSVWLSLVRLYWKLLKMRWICSEKTWNQRSVDFFHCIQHSLTAYPEITTCNWMETVPSIIFLVPLTQKDYVAISVCQRGLGLAKMVAWRLLPASESETVLMTPKTAVENVCCCMTEAPTARSDLQR